LRSLTADVSKGGTELIQSDMLERVEPKRVLRILVLYAGVGGGHESAARAICAAIGEVDPQASAECLDVLKLAVPLFANAYCNGYTTLLQKAPRLAGYLYEVLDDTSSDRSTFVDQLRFHVQVLGLNKLVSILTQKPWDLVIHTHFLPLEITAGLRRQGKIDIPHVTIVTDLFVHRLWIHQPCDHFFVATQAAAEHLLDCGISSGDLTVSGIPIHPKFSRHPTKEEYQKANGVDGTRPVVLELGGGLGMGQMQEAFLFLLKIERPLDILVVTGANRSLKDALDRMEKGKRHRVQVLGMTSRMHELMSIADLVVSKPGGLTVSESLSCGLPICIVSAFPGQESYNSDYLLENGAAVKINKIESLTSKVSGLLDNPVRLRELRRNAIRLSKPLAAFAIAKKALGMAAKYSLGKEASCRNQNGPLL